MIFTFEISGRSHTSVTNYATTINVFPTVSMGVAWAYYSVQDTEKEITLL